MKPASTTTLRFAVSLFAYIIFFSRPICAPGNPVQDFVDGSVATVVVVFMTTLIIRGPGILMRFLAGIVLAPAALFFSFFVFQLIYDVLHGGRIYGGA